MYVVAIFVLSTILTGFLVELWIEAHPPKKKPIKSELGESIERLTQRFDKSADHLDKTLKLMEIEMGLINGKKHDNNK